MKTRSLMLPMTLLLALALSACVDVGERPSPSTDVQDSDALPSQDVAPEPEVTPCEEGVSLFQLRCHTEEEKLLVCLENEGANKDEAPLVWKTAQTCGDQEGCFDSPLNSQPTCLPKFDCYETAFNLMACESAGLQGQDEFICEDAARRMALDEELSWPLYNCLTENCGTTKDINECVTSNCEAALITCQDHSSPGGRGAGSEVQDPATTRESALDSGEEDASSDFQTDEGDGPRPPMGSSEPDAGVDEEPDSMNAKPEPSLPESPFGMGNQLCFDIMQCHQGCPEQCQASCEASPEPDPYNQCESSCTASCQLECREDDEAFAFMALGSCLMGKCSGAVVSGDVQACLWQQCPYALSGCMVANGVEDADPLACESTFTCLLEASTSTIIKGLLPCLSEASPSNLTDASMLMACVGQNSLSEGICPHPEGSESAWANHVLDEASCFVSACSEEVTACPLTEFLGD